MEIFIVLNSSIFNLLDVLNQVIPTLNVRLLLDSFIKVILSFRDNSFFLLSLGIFVSAITLKRQNNK